MCEAGGRAGRTRFHRRAGYSQDARRVRQRRDPGAAHSSGTIPCARYSPGVARSAFDPVADHYARARPTYPAEIYDALEAELSGLRDRVVLDVGAGTGIASRQLSERGARVISLDVGEQMLRKGWTAGARPLLLLADGNCLPLRPTVVEVVCFAQAWHWFDPSRAGAEARRVLVPGGLWAAWWSHAVGDGEPWFDRYQDLMEQTCPNYWRQDRDTGNHDWADEPIAATGTFAEGRRVVTRWTREVTCAEWIIEERSKSYVESLAPSIREGLLAEILGILSGQFPDGRMTVPYRTHMWLARRL